MPGSATSHDEIRVLVLTPVGRNSALVCRILEQAGVACQPCADLPEFSRKAREGAGVALLAQEDIVDHPELRSLVDEARADAEKSRQWLCGIVDSAMDAILTIDDAQRIVLFNPAAERMFRCPAGEALGTPIDRFIPERFRNAHRGHVERFGRTGQTARAMGRLGEISGLRADGDEFPVEASISHIEVSGKKLFSVILRDITERKEAERRNQELHDALRQRNAELDAERARWQGVVEGIADEVWGCDAQGKMGLMNLPAVTQMGLEEFHDKSVLEVYEEVDILYPDGRPRPPQQAPLLRSLGGEIVRGEEIMRHRRTGRQRHRQFSSAPTRDASGAITGAVAIVRDITDLRQAQEELRKLTDELEIRVQERTAQLAAANRDLEAFAYTVSHDLRTPLRHVAAFAELLEQHSGPALDEEGRGYVRNIVSAAARMGRLMDDLLGLSRLGQAALNETDVDLRQVVDEAIRELAPQTEGRRIDWQIGPLPHVCGDPALLANAVVNLLSNAIKYTRRRDPARIEIGSCEQTGEVVVWVRDNGAGFDMRFADKLFGVFQRLHPAEKFEGTGVGLASVRRIIERHGGRTWADGAVDRGATFYFSLPVK